MSTAEAVAVASSIGLAATCFPGDRDVARLLPEYLLGDVVDELVRELAIRVRPALHGPPLQHAIRRRTGALHLPRTVAANLARVDAGMPIAALTPLELARWIGDRIR